MVEAQECSLPAFNRDPVAIEKRAQDWSASILEWQGKPTAENRTSQRGNPVQRGVYLYIRVISMIDATEQSFGVQGEKEVKRHDETCLLLTFLCRSAPETPSLSTRV